MSASVTPISIDKLNKTAAAGNSIPRLDDMVTPVSFVPGTTFQSVERPQILQTVSPAAAAATTTNGDAATPQPGIVAWAVANPMLAAGAALLIIWAAYSLTKKSR